jgi:MFS family permease
MICMSTLPVYNRPLSRAAAPDVINSARPAPQTTADAALGGPPLRRAMSVVTVAWLFGSVWMHGLAGAPLTHFAAALGATNFEFGLMAAIPFVAALAALPASVLIDRTGQRKLIFLIALYVNRLMWVPIAVVPWWIVHRFGPGHMHTAVMVFLVLLMVMNVGGSIGGPAWVSWMADLVPSRLRGRYFARRRQWGICSAIPAALIGGWALDAYAGTNVAGDVLLMCAVLFMIATVFGAADVAMFHFVPHTPKPRPRQPLLRTFAGPLRNKRFAFFCLCSAILWFAIAGQGQFVNKFLIERLHVGSVSVQMIVLVGPLLATLLVLPIWGRVIDRYGKRPAMMIAIVGLVPVGFGWCFLSGGTALSCGLLAALGAVCWTGVEVANFNLTLEFSGTDRTSGGGSAYIAVHSVIVNTAGCMGGLFYGSVAEYLADWHAVAPVLGRMTFYEALFAISAALRLLAIAPLLLVKEPAAKPTVYALRFMVGHLYNNVVGAVMLPMRIVRRGEK